MSSLIDAIQTVVVTALAQQKAIPIDEIWKHVTDLDLVEAVTFVAFGTVWLFYGWRVFKILVTISFGLLGLFLGLWANEAFVGGNGFWLGLICVVFFALLSIPFMRWVNERSKTVQRKNLDILYKFFCVFSDVVVLHAQ